MAVVARTTLTRLTDNEITDVTRAFVRSSYLQRVLARKNMRGTDNTQLQSYECGLWKTDVLSNGGLVDSRMFEATTAADAFGASPPPNCILLDIGAERYRWRWLCASVHVVFPSTDLHWRPGPITQRIAERDQCDHRYVTALADCTGVRATQPTNTHTRVLTYLSCCAPLPRCSFPDSEMKKKKKNP